jgi:acyl dehydratase
MTVVDARPSASKPNRGIVTMDFAMRNQRGETVLTYRCPVMLRRSPAPAA